MGPMTGIYFSFRNDPYFWRKIRDEMASPEIKANWGSELLGHVAVTEYDEKARFLFVSHIATTKSHRGVIVEGKSAGTALALAFRDAVRTNLNARRIIFQETHSSYAEVGYPRFFNRLGAVPRRGGFHTKRSAWHWDWEGPVAGEKWLGEADMRSLEGC